MLLGNVQIWDLASGELKLSLTGHISTVRGLAVSDRHPYMFSCAEDKVRFATLGFIRSKSDSQTTFTRW